MNIALLILGSLGGIIALISAVLYFIKWIIKLVNATTDNTKALTDVNKSLVTIGETVTQHTVDIAVLKDRIKRS